ncbi:MAG: hypothetical protein KAT13_05075 [Methanosarcinales archaeon]|nr:hypothetical protein [Methanosarcinales archaeon]
MNRHNQRTRIPYRSPRNILCPRTRSTAANPGASAIRVDRPRGMGAAEVAA